MSTLRPAIAAHRGGAREAVENSLAAFRYAAGLGVEQVEFDVHRTADGALVVLHDATLERTTTASGPVGAWRVPDLRAVRLREAPEETVPTLEEVLEVLAPASIDLRVEIKPGAAFARYPGIEAELVDRLRGMALLGRTVVTSFLLPVLADAARAGAPSRLWLVAPLVQATLGAPEALARLAREAEVGEVGLHIDHLDAAWVAALRAAGLEVGAWAAHEDHQIDKALALGLSVFTTDRPRAALARRAARLAGPSDGR
jgi:glycerophosphoryl diester phosphodiesterase